MSLQFILGDAGAGKSTYLYDLLIRESMEHPQQKYLLIVPDQFTLQVQKEIVHRHPRRGTLNLDILSFNRLAYHVFKETGHSTLPMLEDLGKTLLLQRVAQEHKGELSTLGGRMNKPGYAEEMKSLVSELLQYEITPDILKNLTLQMQHQPLLQGKLKDIQVLYQGFCDFLEEHYVTAEEILGILIDELPQAESLKSAVFAFDGFTGFTPVQNRLLGELLHLSSRVYVTVTIPADTAVFGKVRPYSRFWMSQKTIHTLCETAGERKVFIEEPVRIPTGEHSRYAHAPALAFLRQHLFAFDQKNYEGPVTEISLMEASNIRVELADTLRSILRLIREEGYRYRDIAIVTGNLEDYGWAAKSALEQAGIPCFLDQNHIVLMNPLVECIRALLDLSINSFSQESIFRYLRCGLSGLQEEEVDELENYCLALGIRSRKKWETPFTASSRNMDPARVPELEQLRVRVLEELLPFLDAMKDRKRTVKDGCEALFSALSRLNAEEQMRRRSEMFREQGDMVKAREYEELYPAVMDLLDKLVEILGEERINLKDFRQILETGLQELTVRIIPPTTDRVIIGDVERTRVSNIRALFFVGVSEDVIPGKSGRGGILSEPDREYLEKMQLQLAPTAREDMYIQKFYLYLHLTKPSDYLQISWANTGSGGEAVGPAYLVGTLRRLFPELVVRIGTEYPEKESLESRGDGIRLLIGGMRPGSEDRKQDWWLELLNYFVRQENWKATAGRLLEASGYRREMDAISAAVAEELYGHVLQNSVSRIESFCRCEYAHFLQYGLRISDREICEFNVMDMGNLLHRAMELFCKEVKKRHVPFVEVEDPLRSDLMERCLQQTLQEFGTRGLKDSAREGYNIVRARKLLSRSIWALQQELKDSDFEPESFELRFDHQAFLDSMILALSEQNRMFLQGKIDRLDLCREKDEILIKIVDYKSGSRKFNLEEFYYGLQLQLVLYLKAATELEERKHPELKVRPAAMLYYQMKDPYITQEAGKDPEQMRLKELRFNGLAVNEDTILGHLDRNLREVNSESRLYHIRRGKTGSIDSRSQVAGEGKFADLEAYALNKAMDTGRRILGGAAAGNPYLKEDASDACQYCSVREACYFDRRLPGCTYRSLKKLSSEELWARIEKEATAGPATVKMNKDDTEEQV